MTNIEVLFLTALLISLIISSCILLKGFSLLQKRINELEKRLSDSNNKF